MISMTNRRIKALALLSGGLDSRLAVCVLKEQGIEVQGIVFESPFFGSEAAVAASQQLDVPLHIADFTGDIISLLDKPKHGFGSNMNPCVDCHARMLKRAGDMLAEFGCRFLATGEVLNERPMSQNRAMLALVARESGYGDMVVRPLSAGLLPETKAEKEGCVDRSRLLSLHGRSRKPQMELAQRYGLADFPTPAGGCRLTEPNFCRRLKDLKEHEGLNDTRLIHLLRVGRHFRLAGNVRLIVGRNESDNAALEQDVASGGLVMRVEGVPGPTAVLPLAADEETVRKGAAICARYSDSGPGRPVRVMIESAGGKKVIEVVSAFPEEIEPLRI